MDDSIPDYMIPLSELEARLENLGARKTTGSSIVVYGDPFNGLIFVGPFDSPESAARYVEKHPADKWHVIQLEAPFDV